MRERREEAERQELTKSNQAEAWKELRKNTFYLHSWVLNDRFHIKIGKAGYSSFITSKKTRNRSFLITEHENSMHGRRI